MNLCVIGNNKPSQKAYSHPHSGPARMPPVKTITKQRLPKPAARKPRPPPPSELEKLKQLHFKCLDALQRYVKIGRANREAQNECGSEFEGCCRRYREHWRECYYSCQIKRKNADRMALQANPWLTEDFIDRCIYKARYEPKMFEFDRADLLPTEDMLQGYCERDRDDLRDWWFNCRICFGSGDPEWSESEYEESSGEESDDE